MRLLDRFGGDAAALEGNALRAAIEASEGRIVMAEVVSVAAPLLAGTSNPEIVCAFGADLVCLNMVDPFAEGPLVLGLEAVDPRPRGFGGLARFLGRPVGLNLEPDIDSVPPAYRATDQTVAAARRGGARFVMITANPGRGASFEHLAAAVLTARSTAPDLLCFAGKMHGAGTEEPINARAAGSLIASDANGVLVPLPGTVPGVTEDDARALVSRARDSGKLAVGTIGTSQEGADSATLRSLALTAKRIGVDVHHFGDAGYSGLGDPEGLYAYSIAMRGKRHTWNRMARSVRASWREGRTGEL
ncbi:MAG: haloacid dehalogenase-like hydrolase [Actinomycetota bacterium]